MRSFFKFSLCCLQVYTNAALGKTQKKYSLLYLQCNGVKLAIKWTAVVIIY